jgi:hypothetical protein
VKIQACPILPDAADDQKVPLSRFVVRHRSGAVPEWVGVSGGGSTMIGLTKGP